MIDDRLNVMVCVTGQKTCERLIVEGYKQAQELGAELTVVHVAKPGTGFLGNPSEGEALEYLHSIATEYGAEMTLMHSEDVTAALINHAKKLGADVLVLGVPGRRHDFDIVHALNAHLPEVSIHVVYTE